MGNAGNQASDPPSLAASIRLMTARNGTQHWRTAQWFTHRCTFNSYEGLGQAAWSEYPTPVSIGEAVGSCGLHLVRWDGR